MSIQPYASTEEKIAAYAKALGHPVRVFILKFLEQQCGCFAGNISEQLPIANSTVSQHLKMLKEAGLVHTTASLPNIKYCINKEAWDEARLLFQDFFKPCC